MRLIIDTNVLVVANYRGTPQASPGCVITCVQKLNEVMEKHTVVLDNQWLIINEYKAHSNFSGQPGVGDAFFKWLLTNQANPERCEYISISYQPEHPEGIIFDEFPHQDIDLAKFDPSDRKFVAVAMAHSEKPPILNAVDKDWWEYQTALEKYGIRIEFLCPAEMKVRRR